MASWKDIGSCLLREQTEGSDPAFWPSDGEYPVYNDFSYTLMTGDEVRNRGYRFGLARHAPDRVVLDIGTGRDLIWALEALRCGARKVYALEAQSDTFALARAALDKMRAAGAPGLEPARLADLELIQGLSYDWQPPEPVDVCVSELIGSIGSCEGAPAALADARRRLMKPEGVMIPERCLTHCAALELPPETVDDPAFAPTAVPFVRAIFDLLGPFDVRLCVDGAHDGMLASTIGVFEDLMLAQPQLTEERALALEVTRDATIQGLLLWIELQPVMDGPAADSLRDETNWFPLFLPLFYPGLAVKAGDRIVGQARRTAGADGVHPDYRFQGRVERKAGPPVDCAWDSLYKSEDWRRTPLYAKLFADKT